MTTQMLDAQSEPKHALSALTVKIFSDFEVWFAAWNARDHLDEKLGLLHGLTMNSISRFNPLLIMTLLDIADGFLHETNFEGTKQFTGYTGGSRPEENRMNIARKAMSVLCLRFFGGETRDSREAQWAWMLENPVLFQKVLWFLRPQGSSETTMRNAIWGGKGESDAFQSEVYRNFLRDFARLPWVGALPRRLDDRSVKEEICLALKAAKPILLNVLVNIRDFDWLGTNIDDETFELLKARVYNTDLYLPPLTDSISSGYHSRKPLSLEEALLDSSRCKEAGVALLYGIRREQIAKSEVVIAAIQARLQEQARARQLEKIERQREQLEQQALGLKGQ